jgi:hypothetical protein
MAMAKLLLLIFISMNAFPYAENALNLSGNNLSLAQQAIMELNGEYQPKETIGRYQAMKQLNEFTTNLYFGNEDQREDF